MDGKPATDMEVEDLGPFADADPAWLRAQILPVRERYERDPSSLVPMEEAFRRVRDVLRDRAR